MRSSVRPRESTHVRANRDPSPARPPVTVTSGGSAARKPRASSLPLILSPSERTRMPRRSGRASWRAIEMAASYRVLAPPHLRGGQGQIRSIEADDRNRQRVIRQPRANDFAGGRTTNDDALRVRRGNRFKRRNVRVELGRCKDEHKCALGIELAGDGCRKAG